MTDTELMTNVMHQIRVNEMAICMLADKAGLDPEEIFDKASDLVDRMILESKYSVEGGQS